MIVIVLLAQLGDTHSLSPHETLVVARKGIRTAAKRRQKENLRSCFVETSSSYPLNCTQNYHKQRLNFVSISRTKTQSSSSVDSVDIYKIKRGSGHVSQPSKEKKK